MCVHQCVSCHSTEKVLRKNTASKETDPVTLLPHATCSPPRILILSLPTARQETLLIGLHTHPYAHTQTSGYQLNWHHSVAKSPGGRTCRVIKSLQQMSIQPSNNSLWKAHFAFTHKCVSNGRSICNFLVFGDRHFIRPCICFVTYKQRDAEVFSVIGSRCPFKITSFT